MQLFPNTLKRYILYHNTSCSHILLCSFNIFELIKANWIQRFLIQFLYTLCQRSMFLYSLKKFLWSKITNFSCSFKVWMPSQRSRRNDAQIFNGMTEKKMWVSCAATMPLAMQHPPGRFTYCLRRICRPTFPIAGQIRAQIFLKQMNPKVRSRERCSVQGHQSEKSLSAGEDTG